MTTFGYEAWSTEQLLYELGRLDGERKQLHQRLADGKDAAEEGKRELRKGVAQTGGGIALLAAGILGGVASVWGIIGFFGGAGLTYVSGIISQPPRGTAKRRMRCWT